VGAKQDLLFNLYHDDITMKTCSKCKLSLTFDFFHKNRIRPDGLQTYCKDCNKVLLLEAHRYKKIRDTATEPKIKTVTKVLKIRQYIFDFLLEHACVDCGETNPIVLEFDHIDPKEKSFTIGEATNQFHAKFDFNTIVEEISKCLVRCSNCHKKKTATDRGYWKLRMLEN